MKTPQRIGVVVAVYAVIALAGTVFSQTEKATPPPAAPKPAAEDPLAKGDLFPVTPPPFTEGVFPCSQCHQEADVVNKEPHIVDFHDTVHFEHDAKNRWCLDCHDSQKRDQLHMADGRAVAFTESYKLCGQCHGPQLRDWKAGDHGKRTGSWSGVKQYMLCVSCHNPHSPHFKPITPMPPPPRQETLR